VNVVGVFVTTKCRFSFQEGIRKSVAGRFVSPK
jgi:hypothetical protein